MADTAPDTGHRSINADLDRELRRARTRITQMQAQLDAGDQYLRVQALEHATRQSETLAQHTDRYIDNDGVLALAEKFYAFLAARQ